MTTEQHGSSPTSCAGSLSECEHNTPDTSEDERTPLLVIRMIDMVLAEGRIVIFVSSDDGSQVVVPARIVESWTAIPPWLYPAAIIDRRNLITLRI